MLNVTITKRFLELISISTLVTIHKYYITYTLVLVKYYEKVFE